MQAPVEDIVENLREKAYAGADYLEMKRYLDSFQLEAETRQLLLLKADDFRVEYQLHLEYRNRAIIEMLGGVLLAFIGIFINYSQFFTGNTQKSLAVGFILFGAWIIRGGYKKYALPPEAFAQAPEKRGKFERY